MAFQIMVSLPSPFNTRAFAVHCNYQIMRFLGRTQASSANQFFYSCLIVLFLAMSIFVALPQRAEALVPFGGPILSVFWCTCSFNLMVNIGPPVPIIAMYQPGMTILYLFGQIWRPGAWTLGLWGPPTACAIVVPYGCQVIATPPMMVMVGTSM